MENQIASRISEKAGELKNMVNQLVDEQDISKSVEKAASELQKFVREHPIPAITGAVVLGFVLGKILKR